MIDRSTPRFDRLAPVYRWMEWLSFGPFLALCRFEYLDALRDRKRALIFGDGDGRFTARLMGTNPDVEVEAVDSSIAMLRVLEGRCRSHFTRLKTTCMDARDWQPGRELLDLVVTHFFLDCLTTEEVGELASRVRSATQPGALWVVSEFAVPPGRLHGLMARMVVDLLYRAFGWMTGLGVRHLPRYEGEFEKQGFRKKASRARLGGLLVSQLWVLEAASASQRGGMDSARDF